MSCVGLNVKQTSPVFLTLLPDGYKRLPPSPSCWIMVEGALVAQSLLVHTFQGW